MATPELPPLTTYDHECVDDYGDFRSKMVEDNLGEWVRVIEVEARERIFLARIAELEADAARYRWLAAKAHKDTAYDRYGNGAHWSIGFFAADGRHALDAAIDAAREAKP